ncbi:MAG: aminotransferase class I/II-fold pyridoxal phosphate-dependent enzyme [Treponemataceae bacterium]|nr:aminotransferase class I/II-fold pyridoxal phosphate-dependent enzyme [Treponemataceae bacterium]
MHGGDIYRNRVKYDFSISVNPLGMSDGVRNAVLAAVDNLGRYPDLRYEKLRAAIAAMEGIRPDCVVCGNGASELIPAFIRMVKPRRILLPVPSFTGYERAIESYRSLLEGICALKGRDASETDQAFETVGSSRRDRAFEGCEAFEKGRSPRSDSALDGGGALEKYGMLRSDGALDGGGALEKYGMLRSDGALKGSDSLKIEYFDLREKNDFSLTKDILPELVDKIKEFKPDLCILTNPNNPCGKLAERRFLVSVAEACGQSGTKLLIDECFMELTGRKREYSFLPLLTAFPWVSVLNAFTKTMAVPGLRLGWCVSARPETARSLVLQLPEWNVSELAQAAGIAASRERAFIEESVALIREERLFLSRELGQLGFHVYPSDANFILFRPASRMKCELFQALLAEGILIRDCRDMRGLGPGFYRIAVRSREENEILLNSLRSKYCKEC